MDSQTKKNTGSIKGLIKSIGIITLLIGFLVFAGFCINYYLDKTNKMNAIRSETDSRKYKDSRKDD